MGIISSIARLRLIMVIPFDQAVMEAHYLSLACNINKVAETESSEKNRNFPSHVSQGSKSDING
jgi:hypothetical protein